MILATYTNRENANAFPKVATLASHCGCTERAIQQRLRRLRLAGYLEIQAPGRLQRATTYRVVVPDSRNETPFPVATPSRVNAGSPQSPSGVNSRSLRGEPRFAPGVNGSSHDLYRDQYRDQRTTGAARRSTRAQTLSPASPTDSDWFAECQVIHNGACGGDQMGHHLRKRMDAYRSKESA
jgi:hypothetical protein